MDMDKEIIIKKYMRIAIEEAESAKKEGENPYGAVLLDSEFQFCHKTHSKSISLSDPTAHAEVQVIREYCRKKISLSKKLYFDLFRRTMCNVF